MTLKVSIFHHLMFTQTCADKLYEITKKVISSKLLLFMSSDEHGRVLV